MADIEFALVLNLHQPSGNLEDLLEQEDWQAREILWAIDRIPRSLWKYEDLGRVHLSLSGSLLETLANPDFQSRVYGVVDCGSLLWYLQNTRVIEVLGTGYYHPVLPLIPATDREEHLHRWRTLASHLLARDHFTGFWPPELGFSMDLVPALCRHRYCYVIVDSEHVTPLTPMGWDELRYRPHLAQFGGEQIVVVVRDRELSNAQQSGMDADWFITEVKARTQFCNFSPLVTTGTDGENGGWFRNTTPGSNFWGGFHSDLMEKVRAGRAGGIRPTFISDYLERHGPYGWVTVEPGAWNTGQHDGSGFGQWTGSLAQQQALTRVAELSQAVHAARRNASAIGAANPELYRHLEDALAMVLRAETSCNFFWGEAWVQRCHNDLDDATRHLAQAGSLFSR
ncbi:MAG: glycoside hydrolase family 57 [Solirubrobacteraceae bacterium]